MKSLCLLILSGAYGLGMSVSASARNLIVLDSGFDKDIPWAYVYDADSAERQGSNARVRAYLAGTTEGGQSFIREDKREFDCITRRSRSLGSKDFGLTGSPDGHARGATAWEPTPTDSNEDVLLDVSCGNEAPDQEHSLGDAEPIGALVHALQSRANRHSPR